MESAFSYCNNFLFNCIFWQILLLNSHLNLNCQPHEIGLERFNRTNRTNPCNVLDQELATRIKSFYFYFSFLKHLTFNSHFHYYESLCFLESISGGRNWQGNNILLKLTGVSNWIATVAKTVLVRFRIFCSCQNIQDLYSCHTLFIL